MALCILYAVWMHVKGSEVSLARYCVIGIAGCFIFGCAGQMLQILVLNQVFYRGFPRARIVKVGHVVRVFLHTPAAITVHAGQYLQLYIPTISLWSLCQTHPFVIASVRYHGRGMVLDLMVEPRRGWTSKLELRAREEHSVVDEQLPSSFYFALFSGPHGHAVNVDNHGLVIMVASGWGIMAQIPYLQHLIRGNNNSTTKARRIHLIWQLGHEGILLTITSRFGYNTDFNRKW